MGISDRDYVRYDRRPSMPFGTGWDVVAWLIFVNVSVYCIQMLTGITEWLALDPRAVLRGQVWRLVTYDFLHSEGSVWHIIVNMYVLFIAGRKLLTYYSQRELLLFYLVSGFLSGIVFLLWQLARRNPTPAIGASGAVAAVMLLYALHWPRDVWMIFGIIPVPVIVLAILSAILDLHPLLGEIGNKFGPDHIAHAAHIGGMAFAFVYYQGNWRLEGLLNMFSFPALRRRLRPKPRLKVHHPTDAQAAMDSRELQEKVDELLEKIHLEGEHSLSDAERDVLNTASRILRNRRGTKA